MVLHQQCTDWLFMAGRSSRREGEAPAEPHPCNVELRSDGSPGGSPSPLAGDLSNNGWKSTHPPFSHLPAPEARALPRANPISPGRHVPRIAKRRIMIHRWSGQGDRPWAWPAGGKSELDRVRWLVTPTRREPRESATEKTPPRKRRNEKTSEQRCFDFSTF